jgi:asparagine synthase (glutamine-hydrolysing)
MCAIFGVFNIKGDYFRVRKQIIKMLKRLQNRGPDATGVAHFQVGENTHHFICHQRLSIVDPFHGDQPFYGQSKKVCCVANGEIYNHMKVI